MAKNRTKLTVFNPDTMADIKTIEIPFSTEYELISIVGDYVVALSWNAYYGSSMRQFTPFSINIQTEIGTNGTTTFYTSDPGESTDPLQTDVINYGVKTGIAYFGLKEAYSDDTYLTIVGVDAATASVVFQQTQVVTDPDGSSAYNIWGVVDHVNDKAWFLKNISSYNGTSSVVDVAGYPLGDGVNDIFTINYTADTPQDQAVYIETKPFALKNGEIAARLDGVQNWMIIRPSTNDYFLLPDSSGPVVEIISFYDKDRNALISLRDWVASGGHAHSVYVVYKDKIGSEMLPSSADSWLQFVGAVPYVDPAQPDELYIAMVYVDTSGETVSVDKIKITLVDGIIT